MSLVIKLYTFAVVVLNSVQLGSALTCKKEGIFGISSYITCPQSGQPSTFTFCCGSEENRYCCENIFGDIQLDKETVDKIVENLPRIIGILVGVVLVVLVVCVVCCCCCPFCLLAKRRQNRGRVVRGETEVTVTVPAQQQAAAQPLQPCNQPQPYIQPQQQYYPQPYPPQPGYPGQQPYPGGPAAPMPGYPVGVNPYVPVPMPMPAQYDQPPPYVEKQPAFNPNYGAS